MMIRRLEDCAKNKPKGQLSIVREPFVDLIITEANEEVRGRSVKSDNGKIKKWKLSR